MNVSSVSSQGSSTLSAAGGGSVGQLEKELQSVQQQIQKENQSKDSAKTKQQVIQELQLEIEMWATRRCSFFGVEAGPDRGAADPGEEEEREASHPAACAEGSGKVFGNHDAASHHPRPPIRHWSGRDGRLQ